MVKGVCFSLAVCLCALGCPAPGPGPGPQPPDDVVPVVPDVVPAPPALDASPAPLATDAGPDADAAKDSAAPVARTACGRAGATLTRLGCRQAKTPEGAPFGDACDNAQKNGRNWHPECIEKISNCSQVDQAYRGKYCP